MGPPNWMSLENKKMFVLNPTTFPPLSELSPENFKRLNSERLKMCFEDGKGECQTKYLPKPTDPGKWKEYQSPGGGHGLFHSILRGHAKLNPHKYDLNLIDFRNGKSRSLFEVFQNYVIFPSQTIVSILSSFYCFLFALQLEFSV